MRAIKPKPTEGGWPATELFGDGDFGRGEEGDKGILQLLGGTLRGKRG